MSVIVEDAERANVLELMPASLLVRRLASHGAHARRLFGADNVLITRA